MRQVLPVFVGLTLGGVAIALAAGASGPSLRAELLAAPISPRLGGDATVALADARAFSQPVPGASVIEEQMFRGGKNLFDAPWNDGPGGPTGFGGLGPTFNREACDDCHPRAGRGRPPDGPRAPVEEMLVRLSAADGSSHPAYGDQLQDRAVRGVPREGRVIVTYEEVRGAYGDGTPYTLLRPHLSFAELAFGSLDDALVSGRVGQPVIGLGLLEFVPEDMLRALEDPDDADGDGISGRIGWVIDDKGNRAAGRFGWKAMHANLVDQAGGASMGDIGLTTPVFAMNCPPVQTLCAAVQLGQPLEMDEYALERVAVYQRLTAVPQARGLDQPLVRRGELAFRGFGCAECHVPTLRTGDHAPLMVSIDRYRLHVLVNQTFHPFTDLLLHDMGEGLADHRPEGGATGEEWRTAPLWGIGLTETVNGHNRLLHDGRARGIAEAILWHGGEAEAAKEAFRNASADTRSALIAFLNAL
jgi:CxxC motif-containing protein (DUF1111 family)